MPNVDPYPTRSASLRQPCPHPHLSLPPFTVTLPLQGNSSILEAIRARISAPRFSAFFASENRPEFTFRAILLGSIFGIIFGAVTVYVGLRAGLTVAASIPIAVLSISILRAFGRASILENNIVQTTGNAGQSIASGVIFTLPALVFLGFDLEYSRIFMLALIGGWLGVLFMIPLRRQLIVEEHGNLKYPEGTACADVLIAGERGGSLRQPRLPRPRPRRALHLLPERKPLQSLARHARIPARLRPAARPQRRIHQGRRHAGVSRRRLHHRPAVAGVIFAGGVFSWLVLMPLIYFFGKELPAPSIPAPSPSPQMGPSELWSTYIRPMGAGAVAAAGLITLIKTCPPSSARSPPASKTCAPGTSLAKAKPIRTEDDLSMGVVVIGSARSSSPSCSSS
jgi:uncharacterized oligopeptide transporter (OPT) family protein